MQSAGWRSYGPLTPGENIGDRLHFGTQHWADGSPGSVETYPHLFVYFSGFECRSLITEENQETWSSLAVELDDPCQQDDKDLFKFSGLIRQHCASPHLRR